MTTPALSLRPRAFKAQALAAAEAAETAEVRAAAAGAYEPQGDTEVFRRGEIRRPRLVSARQCSVPRRSVRCSSGCCAASDRRRLRQDGISATAGVTVETAGGTGGEHSASQEAMR